MSPGAPRDGPRVPTIPAWQGGIAARRILARRGPASLAPQARALLAPWLALLVGMASCAPSHEAVGRLTGPSPSIFQPASTQALALTGLSWLLHAIMAAIFIAVFAALLIIYRRYRARPGNERGRQDYGSLKAELAFTGAPAILLLGVFVLQLDVMGATGSTTGGVASDPAERTLVTVVGRLWWWEYHLPELGVVTANELHLPAGRRAELELTAENAMHNWWVPQLQGKLYNIPGHTNRLVITPLEPGVYAGVCGEFCGVQHAWMRIKVVVESPEQFEAWAASQASPAVALESMSALARQGQQLFVAKNCVSCHAVNGHAAATANAGPNLTHMGSRSIIAAGVLENTPENMALWLKRPQEIKPGNLMPGQPLTDEQAAALAAYMEELK